jgi:hypothetical protein
VRIHRNCFGELEYDAEGKMVSEAYPNAMTAIYAYDATGAPTAIEYAKNAHCSATCPETWFKDAVARTIQGQTASQVSGAATQYYTYDNAGRMTEVQETPVGQKCLARLYNYDEETNRTSETKRECSTETGESEPTDTTPPTGSPTPVSNTTSSETSPNSPPLTPAAHIR